MLPLVAPRDEGSHEKLGGTRASVAGNTEMIIGKEQYVWEFCTSVWPNICISST